MVKTIKNLLLIMIVDLANLTSIPFVYAKEETPTKRPPIIPDSTTTDKALILPTGDTANPEQYFGGTFLPGLTKGFIASAGGLAVLFIIIGSIQILTAYGNDDKIANAKKTITYAIIGLLIAILAYAIVTIISSIQL